MSEQSGAQVRVRDASGESRYEITVDGELAGFAEYRRDPGRIVFTHTEVDDAYTGQGVAGQLAAAALDSAREQSLRVRPECSYIAGYIRKHPEYVDLVGDEDRALIQ